MKSIPTNDFIVNINKLWLKQWFLLTCGDYKKKHYNTMTVAWGTCGIMWNKPIAMVVVRPTRYTYEFINKYDTFTLCAFNKKYRKDLLLLGNKSGRDGDKIAETGLTIQASRKVAAPSFNEAELIIECQKIYWDDFIPEHFLDATIDKNYPLKDYHRFFFGEILNISGIDKYVDSL